MSTPKEKVKVLAFQVPYSISQSAHTRDILTDALHLLESAAALTNNIAHNAPDEIEGNAHFGIGYLLQLAYDLVDTASERLTAERREGKA